MKPGYSLVGGFDIDITGEYNAAGNPNAAHGLWDTQHEELQAEDTAFLQYDMLNDLCYFAQKAENYKTGKQ